ncbi:hypothetical protein ACEPAG_8147 [Sanghuangporus baumii]
MARVTFAIPNDDTEPLLRRSRSTWDLNDARRKSPLYPKFQTGKSILINSDGRKGAVGDAGYLPLYRRKPRHDPSFWKTIICVAIGAVLFVLFIVVSTFLLGEVQHPTGPYPAPPSNPPDQGTPQRNPAYLIEARNGAVASENVVCSEIGVDVLKDGGNAADAAIATTFLHRGSKPILVGNRRRWIHDGAHTSRIPKCIIRSVEH